MEGTPARDERVSFYQLDLLRGIAAVMVVLLHAHVLLDREVAPGGYLAVDLFFALSGFVIAHSYDARLASDLPADRFVLIRLIRFWPLHAAGLLLGLLFELLLAATHNHFAQPIGELLAFAGLNLLFLPVVAANRSGTTFPLNGVSWSLFFELAVNILYAVLFRWLTTAVLVAISAISAVLLVPIVLHAGSIAVGFTADTLAQGLVRTAFSFSIGVLLYRSGFRRLPLPPALCALVLVAALAAPVPAALRPWYDLGFVLVVSPVLVAAGASRQPGPALTRIGTLLGGLSYALYALHHPLLSFASTARTRLALPPVLTTIAFLAAMLLVAQLVHRLLDTPLRRRISSRLGLARAPRPKEVSAP